MQRNNHGKIEKLKLFLFWNESEWISIFLNNFDRLVISIKIW